MKHNKLEELHTELTNAFIDYQFRLDNPFPSKYESKDIKILKYQANPIFRSKVESLVCGVISIVIKYA